MPPHCGWGPPELLGGCWLHASPGTVPGTGSQEKCVHACVCQKASTVSKAAPLVRPKASHAVHISCSILPRDEQQPPNHNNTDGSHRCTTEWHRPDTAWAPRDAMGLNFEPDRTTLHESGERLLGCESGTGSLGRVPVTGACSPCEHSQGRVVLYKVSAAVHVCKPPLGGGHLQGPSAPIEDAKGQLCPSEGSL